MREAMIAQFGRELAICRQTYLPRLLIVRSVAGNERKASASLPLINDDIEYQITWETSTHLHVAHTMHIGGRTRMDIKRSGSQASGKGQVGYFTGVVRIDPLFEAPAPARAVGVSVTFEPGARTAWHSHPLGQTLMVTSGCGRVQRWEGSVEEIRPGDVIWFAPGEKHWHGAAPSTSMTHIAVQERLDGRTADWMEAVSDEQYYG